MLADILARCGAEMGKGEFGGGNDGPLWFLLRNRNSGPISESPDSTETCMYTEANAIASCMLTLFILYLYLSQVSCSEATDQLQSFFLCYHIKR